MPKIARRHVNAAALAAVGAMAAALLAAIYALREQSASTGWVSHTRDVLEATELAVSLYKDVPLATRLYLLDGDTARARAADAAERPALDQLELLRALTADNPAQQQRVAAMAKEVAAGIEANRRLRETRPRLDGRAAARQADVGARSMLVQASAAQLIQGEKALLAARTRRQRRSARLTRALLLLLALTLLAFAFAIWALRRDLRRIAVTETELERAQERLRAIIEGSRDMIVALDRDGRVLAANQALRALVRERFGREVAPGDDYVALFSSSPETQSEVRALWARALSGEEFETVLTMTTTAARHDYELRFTAMTDSVGEPLGAALTARDVTVKLRAERELRRSNEELERFAYVASHDLKEPLRMVVSYTQLLQRRYQGRLDADADQFIRYAVDGAMRMHALIEGLLEYSRVGRAERRIETVDAGKALDAALDNLKAAIAEAGAKVERGQLPMIFACDDQLPRVFQNLLANGIKFRAKDRASVLRVSAKRTGDEWTFSVADNGIGIAAEHLGDVFALFKRLHTHREYPGTGLGLAICKKIVECAGGRIWVESTLGEGSTFYFTARAADAPPPQ